MPPASTWASKGWNTLQDARKGSTQIGSSKGTGGVLKAGGGGGVLSASSSGGSAGGGTTGGGGFVQPSQSWSSTAANPYLDKVFSRFDDLMKQYDSLGTESMDSNPEIQDYQRMRAQGLKQVASESGHRMGQGGGLATSLLQSHGQGTEQGAQKIAADVRNRGLNFKKDLLGSMAGALSGQGNVGSQSAQAQLGLLTAGNEAQRNMMENNYRMARLPMEFMNANISAAAQLAALV